MTEAIQNMLGQVLARWTMGAAAASAAQHWSAEIGDDPVEAELRLLALSGQFLGVAVVAEPAGELRVLPDLPELALPVIPAATRPLARRALQAAKDAGRRGNLLRFLAARGWALHPSDWMPAPGDDDVPDAYAPWRDWQATVAGALTERHDEAELTAESWDGYGPAERAAALAALRRRDPGAARAVLEAKFAGQGAEARLRLLSVLASGLSEADAPFLENLAANDRASKVKTLAGSLLGRLGRSVSASEDAVELAGFFEARSKGILRRALVITPRSLKTSAQHARLDTLLKTVDLPALAAAFGLTATELIAAWPFGGDRANDLALVAMAERSGSDAAVAAIMEALSEGSGDAAEAATLLSSRLAPAQRSRLLRLALGAHNGRFANADAIAAGTGQVDSPLDTAAGAALLAALKYGGDAARQQGMALELTALGLVASRTGAERALAQLMQAGVSAADPRLDMLRFNAALEDRGCG